VATATEMERTQIKMPYKIMVESLTEIASWETSNTVLYPYFARTGIAQSV
jgi:hypothetical protein